jgi:hypothetical protein
MKTPRRVPQETGRGRGSSRLAGDNPVHGGGVHGEDFDGGLALQQRTDAFNSQS